MTLFRSTDSWTNIDTPEDYERAQTEWTNRYDKADKTEVKRTIWAVADIG